MRNGLIEDKTGKFWYKNDTLHRLDGPAIDLKNGNQHWFKEGKRHRESGPALLFHKNLAWFKEGVLHREDGPAKESNDGSSEWWFNGKRHRLDGPAITFINHSGKRIHTWYYRGCKIDCSDISEFRRLVKLIAFA